MHRGGLGEKRREKKTTRFCQKGGKNGSVERKRRKQNRGVEPWEKKRGKRSRKMRGVVALLARGGEGCEGVHTPGDQKTEGASFWYNTASKGEEKLSFKKQHFNDKKKKKKAAGQTKGGALAKQKMKPRGT